MKRSSTDSCRLQPGVKTAARRLSVTTSSSNDNAETDVQLAGNIVGMLQQPQTRAELHHNSNNHTVSTTIQ